MSDREKGRREGERERESEIEIGGGRESKKENCLHLFDYVCVLLVYIRLCVYIYVWAYRLYMNVFIYEHTNAYQ